MKRSINISRPDPSTPWGFRIQGGRDFGQQLRVASVAPGGLAERYGIRAGDQVVTIGGDPTVSMTHQQAQQAVIRCCNQLEIEVVPTSQIVGEGPPAEWMPVTSVPHASAIKAQSTVNINLHKPNPIGHWLRGPSNYQEDEGLNLDSYAPRPYKPLSIKQLGPVEPTPTPSLHEAVAFAKPPYSSQPNAGHMRSLGYKPPPNRNLENTGTRTAPISSEAPVGMKSATVQSQNANRRPICHYCKSPIQGPFVDATDYCFCPEHFFCFTCHTPLNDRYFAEEDGKFYCQEDFVQHVASRCAKCGSPIVGVIIKALDKSWHPHCFVCCYCKRPLKDKFHVEDADQILCEEHWQQLHLTECAKCKQSISEIDRFIEAFGKQFHAKCFCCAACQCPLDGKPFHSRDNKPFCRAHANAAAIFG